MANLKYKRGTKGTVLIQLSGDHTGRELIFVVKETSELTANRIIEKKKSLSEITAVYDSDVDTTDITVQIEAEDTADLTAANYPWDIDSVSTDDVKTPDGGYFTLLGDVQTPFDGFSLPSGATRFLQIDARDFLADIMIITDTKDGVMVFRTITLEELKQKLNQII